MLSNVNPFITHQRRGRRRADSRGDGKRETKIKIAQFGLGPIGLETLKLAATKPWAEIVGGVDIDPAKIGKDLGALTGVKSAARPPGLGVA